MAITAFATSADLLAGWPNKTFTTSEQTAADALLLRASAYLMSKLSARGIEVDAGDELQALNLKTVTCNLVRRAMQSGGAEGISSAQQTIGSTAAQVTWSNPDGSFYLSALDKEILGLKGSGKAGWASLASVEEEE